MLKNQETIIEIESAFIEEDIKKVLNTPQIPNNVINAAKLDAVSASVEQKQIVNKFAEMAENINTNKAFDYAAFQNLYYRQKDAVEKVFSANLNALTSYSPIQIQNSLAKILKKYSLLEVKGSSGYIKLKKIARMK